VPSEYLASLSVEVRAQAWKEQLENPALTMFVAEDDRCIFGFACGGKLRDKVAEFDAELFAIYLLHANQRQGVGTELLRRVAKTLHDLGFRSLLVWVLEQNPAVVFYQILGACTVAQKTIEIGGVQLMELALGWPSLSVLKQA